MIKSYLTIALRTLIRQKGYTAINIIGLAIGMASCILILLYVQDELSYDRHHEKAGQIYRLAYEAHIGGKQIRSAQTPGGPNSWCWMNLRRVWTLSPAMRFWPN